MEINRDEKDITEIPLSQYILLNLLKNRSDQNINYYKYKEIKKSPINNTPLDLKQSNNTNKYDKIKLSKEKSSLINTDNEITPENKNISTIDINKPIINTKCNSSEYIYINDSISTLSPLNPSNNLKKNTISIQSSNLNSNEISPLNPLNNNNNSNQIINEPIEISTISKHISGKSSSSPLNPSYKSLIEQNSNDTIKNEIEHEQIQYTRRLSRQDSATKENEISLPFRAITNSAHLRGFNLPPQSVNIDQLDIIEKSIVDDLGCREIVNINE